MATVDGSISQQGDTEAHFPLAAQIPLSSFTLPIFPPAASHLRSLTLISDINLSEYQSKHLQLGTFEPPTTLPKSITHLTLELFSLGFPAPFLTELAKALPNVQSLTLFSCLIDGIGDSSRKDAIAFFKTAAPSLKELHIVDTFARTGFWKEITKMLPSAPPNNDSNAGLRVVEVSYTYRGHNESDFLNRIAGDEWADFMSLSLIGFALNFSPPPSEEDLEAGMRAEKPEDQEDLKARDGILPFASDGRASAAVRRKFEALSGYKKAEGLALRVLNLSMFAMRPVEIGEIAYACSAIDGSGGLVGLTASILLEDAWLETLAKGLSDNNAGGTIESLEVVGVPAHGGEELATEDAEKLLMKSESELQVLLAACSRLERFEMTLLKSRGIGSIVWEKVAGNWNMQRNVSTAI